jgi:PIN domain nuclease of toxin-antitoxin system
LNGYLLDTHVLIWWLSEPQRLSAEAQRAIRDPSQNVYLSIAAVWEMAIKRALGRLKMPANFPEVLAEQRIALLDIDVRHALAVADLPMIHHDPFDRMQVAQARLENLVLITADTRMLGYDLEVLRA